ncbi:MAG: hypothetical protein MHPSP_004458, partial [Paramarteilia canceri]
NAKKYLVFRKFDSYTEIVNYLNNTRVDHSDKLEIKNENDEIQPMSSDFDNFEEFDKELSEMVIEETKLNVLERQTKVVVENISFTSPKSINNNTQKRENTYLLVDRKNTSGHLVDLTLQKKAKN